MLSSKPVLLWWPKDMPSLESLIPTSLIREMLSFSTLLSVVKIKQLCCLIDYCIWSIPRRKDWNFKRFILYDFTMTILFLKCKYLLKECAGTGESCALERQRDYSGNENKCSLEISVEVTQFLRRSPLHD